MSPFIGLISDTHGLLRPEAIAALQGAELILHAGDIGKLELIEQLRAIAPVHAVRGNIDTQAWAKVFPELLHVVWRDYEIVMTHRRVDVPTELHCAQVVVYGHSHKPLVETINDVVWVNPGSAGPRRFSLPVAIARMYHGDHGLDIESVNLE